MRKGCEEAGHIACEFRWQTADSRWGRPRKPQGLPQWSISSINAPPTEGSINSATSWGPNVQTLQPVGTLHIQTTMSQCNYANGMSSRPASNSPLFVLVLLFIFMCTCLCMCITLKWRDSQRLKEGVGSPGSRIIGGYEPLDVCAGSLTQVLWKGSQHF